MTYYNEDIIKRIMNFDVMLDDNWVENCKKFCEMRGLSKEFGFFFDNLRKPIKILFVVIQCEMHLSNKMLEILSKTTNTDEFKQLKKEVDSRWKSNSSDTFQMIFSSVCKPINNYYSNE